MKLLKRLWDGAKRVAGAIKAKALQVVGVVGGSVVVSSAMVGSAGATLPTGVDTALTAIQTDATSLAGLVAPVMLAILGLTVTFKLIKRFTNKV